MIIRPSEIHDDLGKARLGMGQAALALGLACNIHLSTMWMVKVSDEDRPAFLELAREFAEAA